MHFCISMLFREPFALGPRAAVLMLSFTYVHESQSTGAVDVPFRMWRQ